MALVLVALACGSTKTHAANLHVHDADTITLDGTKIRFSGIDAPELDQKCRRFDGACWPCGRDASTHLRALLHLHQPTCQHLSTDRYGRSIAICTVAGQDVGRLMIEHGWAVPYTKYLKGEQAKVYTAAGEAARKAKRGIWAGEFNWPERWRRGDRLQCVK